MNEYILFVDDDQAGRELSLYNLKESGYKVDGAPDGRQALALFSPQRHCLVITDLRMPGMSGMTLLAKLHALSANVPVIVITAHGNIETAVQAMKAGAYDFIEKPFSRDVLLLSVQRALEHRRLALENLALRIRAAGIERDIVTRAKVMEQLLKTADRVSLSDAAVLLTGESGTGKELVARRLHSRSPRAEGPFITVNCAAMPGELLESELFGHEKGAFTNAIQARQGRFRRAHGGTIFLDEVSEIPLPLQGKLLRALQEKVIDVVGADRPVTVDVRVVAATNRSLSKAITEGGFREDLYYRLNVVELHLPALRERPEDVPPLVHHFVEHAAPDRELVIPPPVMDALRGYGWPGNVRELENACTRLVILCEGDTLRLEDLPLTITPGGVDSPGSHAPWPTLPPEGLSLMDLERRVIQQALQLKEGNVTQAAQFLRIPRHVLAYRIKKFGI